ncbi:MAG: hypothetical protein QOE65_2504 [Solirubrobacteraceae bacterium]|jgi:signal transduction histidine kinase|nr:hypothetical protein [Solirubrobacteraceae bacterium]
MIGALRIRLLAMTLVPLVPLLVVAFVNARQTREASLDQARGDVRALARLAGGWVDQRVDSTTERLRSLTPPADAAGCARALRVELRRGGGARGLLVAGPDGRLRCAAGVPAGSVAGTAWFRALRPGRRGAVGVDARGGRPRLVVAVPRPGGGAVAAVLDLRVFDRLGASAGLPRQASLVLLARGGVLLARHPALPGTLGRSVSGTPLGRAARTGARDADVAGLDGVRRIYGFDRPAAGALVVATGLPRADLTAPADRALRRTLIVLGLVALLAVGLVFLLADLLVARPLRGAVADREAETERSGDERRRLLSELVAAEDAERQRIAEDIHDDSIQALAALLLRLEMLEAKLTDDGLRGRMAEARESARAAVTRLRHLMFQLNPPALETSGLAVALTQYVEEVGRVWGPEASLRSELDGELAGQPRALAYRIAIEAVNNAAKHAQAGHIDVTLASQDGGVRVRVQDDGRGFDTATASPRPGHMGLRTMRERAEAAGGWWRLESEPGRGTTVEFFVPG